MAIIDLKGERATGLICQKCIENYMGKSPTACTIEVDGKAGLKQVENIFKKGSEKSESVVYSCHHCTLKTTDRGYFMDHSCANYVLTKDFVKSITGDKDDL